MPSVWKSTLESIRISTASERPLATSGAVSIIVAVYGCSLALMALRLTLKGKVDRKTRLEIADLIRLIEEQSDLLRQLADRDIKAFQTFLAAVASKRRNTAKPRSAATTMNASVLEVTRIPLLSAAETEKIFPLLVKAVPLCRENLRCDLAAAANNCACAISNLVLNIAENANQLEPAMRAKLNRTGQKLVVAAVRAAKDINRMISSPED